MDTTCRPVVQTAVHNNTHRFFFLIPVFVSPVKKALVASRFTVVSLHCMADDETHMVYLCLLESNSHTFLKYNCGVI